MSDDAARIAELEAEVAHWKWVAWLVTHAAGGRVVIPQRTKDVFNPAICDLVHYTSVEDGSEVVLTKLSG